MKKNTATLALSFAIIALGIAALFYVLPRSASSVSAQDAYPVFPTPTTLLTSAPTITQDAPVAGISRDALQKYASGEIVTQTVNGIEMSASNFRIEGNLLKVNICFTSPDNNEWTLGAGVIQIGDDELLPRGAKNLEISRTLNDGRGEITIISGSNINVQKTDDSAPNYRCDTLEFPVAAEQMNYAGAASLTVKYINTFPTEGHPCAFTEKTQNILTEKGLDIKIACTQTDSDGMSSGKTEILEKPQAMSEEEARRHISEAYRQAITIDGPWVFEGTVTTMP